MLATFLALTVAAPAVKDKTPDPAAALLGLWELDRTEGGSGQPQKERTAPLRNRFDKDGTWTVLEGDREVVPARAVKVDGSAKPATLDFTVSKDGPRLALGIFKVDGDTLTICSAFPGKDRPIKFESTGGEIDYHQLAVFRRVKAK